MEWSAASWDVNVNFPWLGPVVWATTWPEGSSCRIKIKRVCCGIGFLTYLDVDDDAEF